MGGLASTAGLFLADDADDDVEDMELSEHSVVVELESSSISDDDDGDEDALFRSLALLGLFETAVAATAGEVNAAEGSSLGGVLDRRFFWDRLSDGGSAALLDSGAGEVGLELLKPPLNLDVKSFHVLLNAPPFPFDILALDLPPDFLLEPLPWLFLVLPPGPVLGAFSGVSSTVDTGL